MKGKNERAVTGKLYPGLTRETLRAREDALRRFARWEKAHPPWLPASDGVAEVAALCELLPPEGRRRAPDPSGVQAFHTLIARMYAARR